MKVVNKPYIKRGWLFLDNGSRVQKGSFISALMKLLPLALGSIAWKGQKRTKKNKKKEQKEEEEDYKTQKILID